MDNLSNSRYWRALSQKGLFVLSAPYQDLWGAGYLLTLTQTIFEGRCVDFNYDLKKIKQFILSHWLRYVKFP